MSILDIIRFLSIWINGKILSYFSVFSHMIISKYARKPQFIQDIRQKYVITMLKRDSADMEIDASSYMLKQKQKKKQEAIVQFQITKRKTLIILTKTGKI